MLYLPQDIQLMTIFWKNKSRHVNRPCLLDNHYWKHCHAIQVTATRVSIGLDNGLSPIRCHAIIWTNAGLLSIGPLGTNSNEISIKIQNLSFTKMQLKISSEKWRPFCKGEVEFKSSTRRLTLIVSDLQMSFRDLSRVIGYRDSTPGIGGMAL